MGRSPTAALKHGRVIVIGVVLDQGALRQPDCRSTGLPASPAGAAFHSSITRTSGWARIEAENAERRRAERKMSRLVNG